MEHYNYDQHTDDVDDFEREVHGVALLIAVVIVCAALAVASVLSGGFQL